MLYHKRKENKVSQSCPTLCNPTDCSPPDSSIHGLFQARVLEWVAISFSKGCSQPRDRTQVSRIPGRRFTAWATRQAWLYRNYPSIKINKLKRKRLSRTEMLGTWPYWVQGPCTINNEGQYFFNILFDLLKFQILSPDVLISSWMDIQTENVPGLCRPQFFALLNVSRCSILSLILWVWGYYIFTS